jgi:hypothetical protein
LQDRQWRETLSALKTDQRRTLARCLKKLTQRKQTLAIGKWYKEFVNVQRNKEDKAAMVLSKIRKNIVSQFFRKYKNNAFFMRKMDI